MQDLGPVVPPQSNGGERVISHDGRSSSFTNAMIPVRNSHVRRFRCPQTGGGLDQDSWNRR